MAVWSMCVVLYSHHGCITLLELHRRFTSYMKIERDGCCSGERDSIIGEGVELIHATSSMLQYNLGSRIGHTASINIYIYFKYFSCEFGQLKWPIVIFASCVILRRRVFSRCIALSRYITPPPGRCQGQQSTGQLYQGRVRSITILCKHFPSCLNPLRIITLREFDTTVLFPHTRQPCCSNVY